MAFEIRSPAFSDGGSIPARHTCDGEDVSPPLSWSDAPRETASFALICDDPDAPGRVWVHWVAFDLPSGATGLPEGVPTREAIAGGGLQGTNDFRRIGYGGPCPPTGTHRYEFRLYALDATLGLRARATKKDLLAAMEGRVLAEAKLTGKYSRR